MVASGKGQGDGGDFAPLLRWSRIAGPISFPVGSAVQSQCEPLWPTVKATFPLESDAGVVDGGDGGTSPALPQKGCGCGVVEGPLGLAMIVFLRRRRAAC